jgi:hypothetical protein
MSIFNKIRGGAGQSGYPPKKKQFNQPAQQSSFQENDDWLKHTSFGNNTPAAAPAAAAPAARIYEKDERGLNKMPKIDSLGAPKSGRVFHNTPKGSTSPLRHEVTSYGDMHTINTYGQTAKGEARIGSWMTDQEPSFDKDSSFGFGGGNTFDMATGQQSPSGARWGNAKMTREWKNQ